MAEQETRPDPAPITSSPDRIKERPYESDWAGLPPEETDGQLSPGSGPEGNVGASGRSVPLTTIAVGFGVLFLTFFLAHWAPLVLGLVLIVVGAVWSGLTERRAGTFHGVGTLTARQQRKRE